MSDMRRTVTLATRLTADQVEARADHTLRFRMEPIDIETERYAVGTYADVYSSDGCVFIGEVSDVDDDALRFYVELM